MDPTGKWDVSDKQVLIGAAVALTVVGIGIATGGAGLAVLGMLAETGAAGAVVADAAAATLSIAGGIEGAKGLVDANTTIEELRTGKDASGADIDPNLLSRKLGALPVQVVASAFGVADAGMGAKNLFGGGGGGPGLALANGGTLSSSATATGSLTSLVPVAGAGIGGGLVSMAIGQGAGGGGDGGSSGGGGGGSGSSNSESKKTEVGDKPAETQAVSQEPAATESPNQSTANQTTKSTPAEPPNQSTQSSQSSQSTTDPATDPKAAVQETAQKQVNSSGASPARPQKKNIKVRFEEGSGGKSDKERKEFEKAVRGYKYIPEGATNATVM
jgi:hypothetical protein